MVRTSDRRCASAEDAPSAVDLLEHGRALHRLAQRLLPPGFDAEDLVQHAYQVALERPPCERRSLGAWLRQVVRRRACDLRRLWQRRAQREREAARAERVDESTEARLRAKERLLAAVRALPEPYRTAIVKRYYDGLPPRRIAHELGSPVKTVKTRLSRGIELLRRELDVRHGGDRRAWAMWLAPAAGGWSEGLAAACARRFLEASGVAMAKKVAFAGAALLLLLGFWRFVLQPEASDGDGAPRLATSVAEEPRKTAGEEAADHVARRTGDAGIASPSAVVATEEEVAPFGSLMVIATWAGTPDLAAAVGVIADATEERALDRNPLLGITDALGSVGFARLRAGIVRLSSDRGGLLEARVEAGRQTVVEFDVPSGVAVRGVVVDEMQRPVPHASIWMSAHGNGWLGGRVVSHADGEGRFAVPGVNATQSLGALAPGYAPSDLVDLELAEIVESRAEIRLQLARRGARLEGRVVDEAGRPIAGAMVAIGRHRGFARRMGGSNAEGWNALVQYTDADGRFTRDDAAPGECEISVRAEGFALGYVERVLAAEQSTFVEIALSHGAVVHGVVSNAGGEPVGGAEVLVLSEPEELERPLEVGIMAPHNAFGRPRAFADAAGRYALAQVPAGEVRLIASARRGPAVRPEDRGTDQLALQATPGANHEWNPRLSPGLVIRGRVRTTDGKAPEWISQVRAEPEVSGAVQRSAYWDEEGRFALEHCADVTYTLIVEPRAGAPVRKSGVRGGGEEIEIELPEVTAAEVGEVSGRLVADAGAALPAHLRANLQREDDGSRSIESLDGDRFRFERVAPGRVRILAVAGDAAVLATDWFELRAGEKLELGDLRLPIGGVLEVELVVKSGALSPRPRARVGTGFLTRELAWDGARFHGEGLLPGRTELHIADDGLYATPREVEIVSGAVQRVAVEVERGFVQPLELRPASGAIWQWMICRARDGEREIWRQRIRNVAGLVQPIRRSAVLPHRPIVFEVEDDAGRRKTSIVDVAPSPGTARAEPLVLALTP